MTLRPCPTSDAVLQSWLQCNECDESARLGQQHLNACPSCRARLESLAATALDWQLAAEAMSDDHSGFGDKNREQSSLPVRPTPVADDRSRTEAAAIKLLTPPVHPELLGRLGRYDVERLIGSGGMGVVFRAFDGELNRPVAIKALAPFLANSGRARQRFAREARAAAAIVHEHVVAIHDIETDAAVPYLVMHFVAGESLQQRLDRQGALELCEVLRIGMQTASALSAAHAQGIIHRDVKPSNILLERGVDRALLTDFGLARAADDMSLTHTGVHPGTPQYMSPEQVRGESIDARSDLFSLGSVLYAMSTGVSPFRADSTWTVLHRITDAEAKNPRAMNAALPDWFERLLQRFHSKSVGNRIGSAKEAEWLLQQCLAHVQRPTMVQLPKEVNPKRPRTLVHRMAICVVMAIAVGALLVEITRKDILVSTAQPVSPSSRLTASTTSETTRGVWAEWDREVQQIEQSLSELETTPGEDEQ